MRPLSFASINRSMVEFYSPYNTTLLDMVFLLTRPRNIKKLNLKIEKPWPIQLEFAFVAVQKFYFKNFLMVILTINIQKKPVN